MGRATQQLDATGGSPAGAFRRIYNHRRRAATVAAALLAVGLAYHVVFGQNGLTVYERKRTDATALSHQVDKLAEENDRLRVHVTRLQTDPGAIEHQAREELHYTRPGEVIITLPNERPSTLPTPPTNYLTPSGGVFNVASPPR